MSLHPDRLLFSRALVAVIVLTGLNMPQRVVAGINLPQANGDTLTLPAPAGRIITLAPNLAELVFAAGAGGHLKAVVEYSNFPEQVKQIPRIGDAFRVDLERIIELKPNLVIAWKSGNPQAALQKLEHLGITVWQIEINRPEEIVDAVEYISLAAGTEDHGRMVASQLRNRLARLRSDNADKTVVDYFYQIAAHPLYTINGQHIISHSLAICGAHNVFSDLPTVAPQISRESVILANPQAMIAPQVAGQPPALDVWRDWPQLQAVQNNTLIHLPADEINQATPRLLDSIGLACKLLDGVRQSIRSRDP